VSTSQMKINDLCMQC